MPRPRRNRVALICFLAVGLIGSLQPAEAALSRPFGSASAAIGSKNLHATTSWGTVDKRADTKYCPASFRMRLRATFFIDRVSKDDISIRKVRIDWRTRNAGYFAGYALYGEETVQSGRTPEPEMRLGKGSFAIAVDKTLAWFNASKRPEVLWEQSVSFLGDPALAATDVVKEGDPSGCHRNTFLFHLFREARGECEPESEVARANRPELRVAVSSRSGPMEPAVRC